MKTRRHKSEWKRRYISQLMKHGFTEKQAKDHYDSGKGTHDYDDSPEDQADDEYSYWQAEK